MTKSHLKRLASPKTWPISKKTLTYVARPFPGPHKMEYQVPITVFLRDMVKVLKTNKEVKYVLHNKDCLVDGVVIHDDKRPVGLFDVVSLPKLKKHFRVLINSKNKLYGKEISEKEATIKISKLTGKSTLKKGVIQLNTLDGRNIVSDKEYPIASSLVLGLPDQKVSDVLSLEKGASILLIGGSHVGVVGTIESIDGKVIVVKAGDHMLKTMKRFAVVVGKSKPVIEL